MISTILGGDKDAMGQKKKDAIGQKEGLLKNKSVKIWAKVKGLGVIQHIDSK